jgi:chromosome segregation protein
MYLKSLNINGFKSFAEKTNIDFTDKVNVIVGPNGSGKSNVVDAISWVLGTQSPASLRTNKMEDVIFAGTEKLQQKGFSEVYLNFEVDEAKFNGNSEISIGRKLFRDGTSEYFMNGVNCRLLDIQEFLIDVGIGKQQHIIISQGQIAEILNSKPEDHRTTIEEAAGILPLRIKKEKSLKRIESGEKEIKRAKDVLREIKKQLNPLKEQAEKAKLHQENTDLLKDKSQKLNVLMYKKFRNLHKNYEVENSKLDTLLSKITNEVEDLKLDKIKLSKELGDGNSLGTSFKEYSSSFSNISEKMRSIAHIASERRDNLDKEKIKFEEENERISKKIKLNNEQVVQLSNQLLNKKVELSNLQSIHSDVKNKLENIIKKSSASIEVNEALLDQEILNIQKDIDNSSRVLNDLENQITKWNKDLDISQNLYSEFLNGINLSQNKYRDFDNYSTHSESVLNRELDSSEHSKNEELKKIEILKEELKFKNTFLASVNDEDFKNELKKDKESLEKEFSQIEEQISNISNQLVASQEKINFLTNETNSLTRQINEFDSSELSSNRDGLTEVIDLAKVFIDFSKSTSSKLTNQAEYFEEKYGNSNKKILNIDSQIDNLNRKYFEEKERKTDLLIKLNDQQNSMSQYYSKLINIFGLSEEEITNFDTNDLNQKILEDEISIIESKIEEIGTVNYLAKEDFESLNERFESITNTIDDLNLAKKELLQNIEDIEKEIVFRIESSFNSISVHFTEIFETLFPGGKGSLSFTNKENILETGIEISVQPRGKKVKKLSLLSGGERSLAAIAFLFSIFKSFPSPFYILDEVEAALDDANLHRMINLLNHVKDDAQFLIVTHQQQTMHAGDVLYGVTMEPGSGSRVFTKTKEDFESLIKNNE